jgi:hypothetical protein
MLATLLTHMNEILGNFNLFFISLWLISILIVLVDLIFLFKKKSLKDYKLVLLLNAFYSLFSGLEFRIGGYIISNNLGADISVYFKKNSAGTDYGFYFDTFNLVSKLFFYDNSKYPQLSIQINLIMLSISILFFYFYNKMQKPDFILPN